MRPIAYIGGILWIGFFFYVYPCLFFFFFLYARKVSYMCVNCRGYNGSIWYKDSC